MLRPGFHPHAAHVVARLGHQESGHAGVHSPAHAEQNTLFIPIHLTEKLRSSAKRVNIPGSIGCQPVLFSSLPKRNVVGSLPTPASKLPALPQKRECAATA